MRRALDVLAELPAAGLPLAVFAADLTGDAHALDRATLLGSLVAGGLRHINPSPGRDDVDKGESDAGPSWREAWARVGVVCDEVSVSVLVLNLDVSGRASGLVSSAILDHRDAGLPLRLTLQQLRAETLRFAPGAIVRTCENPSVVVRASAMLGAGAGPLVCTDGQPNSAVDELFRQMRSSGARLAHHGDFEWGGIRVANYLVERHLAEPWRFSTRDYLESAPSDVVLGDPRGVLSASWTRTLYLPCSWTDAGCSRSRCSRTCSATWGAEISGFCQPQSAVASRGTQPSPSLVQPALALNAVSNPASGTYLI